MGPRVDQRISPNRVALVLVLLLAAWLVFQFLPRKGKPVPAMAPVAAESRLRSVGLADNPDWEGLPEFFTLMAAKAEWKDGRTRFAYWHPVMKTYSYYFEAIRDGADFRFREIAEPCDENYEWDPDAPAESPLRLFLPGKPELIVVPVTRTDHGVLARPSPEKVEIELPSPQPLPVPPISPPKAEN